MARALKERINADLKTALLGGDRFKGEVLRGLKASILNEEVAKNMRDAGLDDSVIEQVIAREVKKRHESAELYEQNGRPEAAETERHEAEVLSEYLPKQLTSDELQAIITETIQNLGATSPSDMGRVIGAVKAKVGTTASGQVVAELVKQSLN